MKTRDFLTGQSVYCIDESVFEMHLTKRKMYEIHNVGTESKEGKIRIKGDMGRLVWISTLNFSDKIAPKITSIVLDDEIRDSRNDFVEVTVNFEDKSKRYLSFMTVQCLSKWFSNFNRCFSGNKILFVQELNKKVIEEIIIEMDLKNELLSNSKEI